LRSSRMPSSGAYSTSACCLGGVAERAEHRTPVVVGTQDSIGISLRIPAACRRERLRARARIAAWPRPPTSNGEVGRSVDRRRRASTADLCIQLHCSVRSCVVPVGRAPAVRMPSAIYSRS
jgi:hypothetical protein